MLSYFMSPEYTISDKLVQVMYILSGLFCMYCGVRAWIVKANKHFLPSGSPLVSSLHSVSGSHRLPAVFWSL